jgi:hypothetical protein
MSAVIKNRFKISADGKLTIIDPRLQAGEEVDVEVRVVEARTGDLQKSGFLSAARKIQIDAPPDYSVSFEDSSRPPA